MVINGSASSSKGTQWVGKIMTIFMGEAERVLRERWGVQAHVTVGAGLSDTTRGMQEVVGALRTACAEISGESAKVHRSIDAARRHLQAAFADHTAACRCDSTPFKPFGICLLSCHDSPARPLLHRDD